MKLTALLLGVLIAPFNDSLQLYNDPDLNTVDYQDRTVFIPQ